MSIPIELVIEIVTLAIAFTGAYWKFNLEMNKRFADQDAKVAAFTALMQDRPTKDQFQRVVNGIRADIIKGMEKVTESYHELDKKDAEHELRLKTLESND